LPLFIREDEVVSQDALKRGLIAIFESLELFALHFQQRLRLFAHSIGF